MKENTSMRKLQNKAISAWWHMPATSHTGGPGRRFAANWGVWAVPARATSLNKIITTMTTRPKKQNESRTQKSRKFPRRVNNLYTLKKMILIIFKFSPTTKDI